MRKKVIFSYKLVAGVEKKRGLLPRWDELSRLFKKRLGLFDPGPV